MPKGPRILPPHPALMNEFLDGASYAQLAKKYGIRRKESVYQTLKNDCNRHGVQWPLTQRVAWGDKVKSGLADTTIDPTGIFLMLDMHLEEEGITLYAFCKKHGFNGHIRTVYHHQGDRRITREYARRLLTAMGEPVTKRLDDVRWPKTRRVAA